MKISKDRILTTHVGSLPRSEKVFKLIFAREGGEELDNNNYEKVIADAVKTVVIKQEEAGIDIVSDGEQSKISYATYIKYRLNGFEGDSPRRTPRDLEEYPEFSARASKSGGVPTFTRPRCTGEVSVKDTMPLEIDLENFRNALQDSAVTDAFMNAASPGVIALFQPNDYYTDHRSYLYALAEAMKVEYEGIAKSGFVIQIDSPDLALGRHVMFKDKSDSEFVAMVELHIEALNHALETQVGAGYSHPHRRPARWHGAHVRRPYAASPGLHLSIVQPTRNLCAHFCDRRRPITDHGRVGNPRQGRFLRILGAGTLLGGRTSSGGDLRPECRS